MPEKTTRVNCPTCQEIVEWKQESPYRPFCSERCKLIDFGEWASEKNSIPGEPADPEVLMEALTSQARNDS